MHASSPEPVGLSQNARTWISLAIFIHLFIVAVALASYTGSSPLEDRLRAVLAPYARTLNFDLYHPYRCSPRYFLTHVSAADSDENQQYDIDFKVEIGPKLSDPAAPRITIPPDDLPPGIRRARYQALANVIGATSGEESYYDGLLVKPIGAAALAELDVKKADVRCRGRLLPSIDDLKSGKPPRNDPNSAAYDRTFYSAQIFKFGDDVNLLRSTAAGEVSPVRKTPSAKSPTAGGNSSGEGSDAKQGSAPEVSP